MSLYRTFITSACCVVLLFVFSELVIADINATYYDQNGQQYQYFTGTEIITVDPNIDFNWGGGSPRPGMAANDFSVRWEGELEVPADGNYNFRVRGDDGIRIWVDGNLLVNDWSNHGPRNRDSSAVALLAGQRYSILVEMYERGGGAVAQVSWSGPTTGGWQIIPQNYLFTDNSPPEVDSAAYGCSADSITINFNKGVDPVTAETVGNYVLDNGASVFSATLDGAGRSVTLQTSDLTADEYLVTINNIEDTSGGVIAANTTVTASFRISGLTATYFDQNNNAGAYFTGSQVERVDATVDFNWGTGSPVAGIGNDRFSVRWEGYVIASSTDDFEFRTRSDDGVRLWIDGNLVIDNWTNHGPRYDYSAAIALVAGQQYEIRLEYFENGGGAVAQLQWQNSSFSWQTIPQSQLLGTCGLPTLSSASFSCTGNTINLTFSEQLDILTAEDTANYTIDRSVTVNAASLGVDGKTVTLETSSLGPVDYLVTVNNVEDSSGIAIEPDSQIAAAYQASGLQATYYDQDGNDGAFFTGNTIEQVDAIIDNNWGSGVPVAGIGANDFSVRWEGYIQAPADGDYIFRSRSDDGFRLYLDDVEIIDHWSDHGPSYRSSAVQTLVAGQSYKIVVEYYENGGGAVAQLEWSGPGFSTEIIAAEYFTSACEIATASWQLDEVLWNGTGGEVVDSSGGGHNGTALGFGSGPDNPKTAYADPAVSGNPGTCRYGEFDGVDDYIEIADSSDLDNTQQLSLTAWFKADTFNQTNGTNARGLFSKRPNFSGNVSYGAFFLNGQPGYLYVDIDSTNNRFRSNTLFELDRWYHVAIVFDGSLAANERVRLYVDGVLDGAFNESSSLIPDTDSNFYIGNLYTGLTQLKVFDGAIDEVNVIPMALTPAEVNDVMAETRVCDVPTTDHFDIDHSGSAIFCAPTLVTVTAEDITDATDVAYARTVTLDTGSGDGNWILNSGDGSFDNGTDGDGVATYTYSINDNGVASFLLDRSGASESDLLTINIAVTDGGISDDNDEGDLTFAVSGFTITGEALTAGVDPATLPIGTQVAGTDFNAYIAAYGQSPTDPVCGVIEAYTGDKTLTFAVNYNNPNTGVEGVIASPSPITFNQGQAVLPLKYKDVGSINFTANDGSLSGAGINDFVVLPHHFAIYPSGTAADVSTYNAADENGVIYRKAGEDFDVTVIALDEDNDPVQNYGKESPAESILLTHTLLQPTSVHTGVLTGALSRDSDATFVGTYQWDEVGIISLQAAVFDRDYLGAGDTTSVLSPVGRFTPDHLVLESASITPALESANFTYMEQPFLINYTLRAVAQNGATIKNYQGDFSKLASDSNDAYGAVDGITYLSDRLTADSNPISWTEGVAIIIDAPLIFIRESTADGPFANVNIGLSIADSDGITFQDADLNLDTVGPSTDSDSVQIGSATEFRYGRVFIPPVYGPEINAGDKTAIPFLIEYWGDPDSNGVFEFVTNTQDSETDYSGWDLEDCIPGAVSCADIAVNPASMPPAVVVFGKSRSGDQAITIDRPGAGNTGDVTIQIDVDEWFEFDWDSGWLVMRTLVRKLILVFTGDMIALFTGEKGLSVWLR
nr:PA14 domain-containing protein [Oceanicoccus sp. KOV_DT_Chl]